MKKVTLLDLVIGTNITIKPAMDEGDLYFHVIFENMPYFVLSDYHSVIDWDEDTLRVVTSEGLTDKNVIKEFRDYIYSCIPSYEGWEETIVDYKSIHCDANNILRVNFKMSWCELKK